MMTAEHRYQLAKSHQHDLLREADRERFARGIRGQEEHRVAAPRIEVRWAASRATLLLASVLLGLATLATALH